VRQQDKKRRKLAREKGDPAFVALSRDKSHLDTLVDWKHAQCLRTTQPGVWDTRWVRETLDWLWEHNAPDCRPALFTLVGEEGLIAAAFCLASPWVLHVWLIGYDEAYGAYSPGVLLSRFLCEWAADNGFSEVDFGAGDYRYKRELTTTTRQLAWGFLARPSLAGAVRAAECAARAYAEKHPNWGRWSELPGKAMRRLDAERGLGLFFR
jgi:CelD/BcsL family acetyltransferase involved in cellulose biosynthesis